MVCKVSADLMCNRVLIKQDSLMATVDEDPCLRLAMVGRGAAQATEELAGDGGLGLVHDF